VTTPPQPPSQRPRPAPRWAAIAAAYGLHPAPELPAPSPAPPRTSGALRPAITGTPGTERFQTLIRSAYRDSLEQLAGAPSVYAYDAAPDAAGEYRGHPARAAQPGADTVLLSPAALETRQLGSPPRTAAQQGGRQQPEFVLAHELGHRNRDARSLAAGGADPVVAQQDSVFAAQAAQPPRGTIASAYWTANPDEHYAEAFANGVSYLRATAGNGDDPDVASRVQPTAARYERAVPGTRQMTAALLADPLYDNHPLRRATQPRRAAADATRVRNPRP
jgi:hypothetical protein